MTVMSLLHASAVSGRRSGRAFAGDRRAARLGAMRVQDAHRDVPATAGRMVPDAAPSRRSTPARTLRRTTATARPRPGDDARIGGEHAVDVGPDLDLAARQAGAEERRGVVRPAAAQRRRDAVARGADEAAEHRQSGRRRASGTTCSSALAWSPARAARPPCARRRSRARGGRRPSARASRAR